MAWPDGSKKYDLHRHFGGSLSVRLVTGLLNRQGTTTSEDEVRARMVCAGPQATFADFLAKFQILNDIHWTENAIAESIDDAVRVQAEDGIDYSETSFSIDKYMDNHVKWTRPELIKFIHGCFRDACRRWRTEVGLILSLRMEADRWRQEVNAALIRRDDMQELLTGLDIVGDELQFDVDFYEPIFREWHAAGKVLLGHVGEIGPVSNVMKAITRLRVHRVRHGTSGARDREVLAAARDLGVCFDISLHSNMLAGTVSDMRNHHLPALLAAGCAATLGTDDPVTFDCGLADEYRLAEELGLLGRTELERAANASRLMRNSVTFSALGR